MPKGGEEEEERGLLTCPPLSSLRHRHSDRHRAWPIAPEPDPLPPSLPLRPAHPGGLFSSPARANPRLGVSRASRFLVLRKKEQGVGVGQQRRQTRGSEQSRELAVCRERTDEKKKTPRHEEKTKNLPGVEREDDGSGDPRRRRGLSWQCKKKKK